MITALLVSIDISCYYDCYYNHYFNLAVDSVVVLLRKEGLGSLIEEEDFSIRNKLQPGGQELMDSIFGYESDTESEKLSVRESATHNAQIVSIRNKSQEKKDSIFAEDSDTESEKLSLRESATLNVQIAIPYNFQILTAKTSKENGNILEREVILRLHENYKRAKEDFQLTIETILRYLEYNMSFKTFFIFCESAPYTFYNELYEKDNTVQPKRKSIIDGSKKYLSNLCSSMFKFLKQLSYHYQGQENFNLDALEDLFPEIPISNKTLFLETLNKPEVLKSIFSVTREEELLLNISNKSFRNYKYQLIENISDNVIKNSDKTPEWILSNENIKTIVSNLSDFGVAERKISAVRGLLKDYISVENHLPYADHRYPTRSKDGGAPFVSYFGQASTSVTANKGSRKRAISDEIISSSSKEIRTSGNVKTARSPLPDKKKRVVELEIPVSMIEDDIKSKKVVESLSDALIEAQDQRPIEDNKASDNLEGVTESISLEEISSSSKHIRTSETVNTSRSPLPDKNKRVVEHQVPVSMIEDDIESMKVVKSKSNAMIVEEDQRPIEDNQASDNLGPDVKMEVVNVDSTSMSPISKVHIDDHSMDVDNGEEFQSTHTPSIMLSEKRREVRDSFNEDESVFLVNTSFSSVKNPNDLKFSLSNRIREIKAICAHFELDFESLSSGVDNVFSGLDMSIIESKVQDLSDKTLDVDLTRFPEVDLTRFPDIDLTSTQAQAVPFDDDVATSCQKALDDFNEKSLEINFLELMDKFPMEEGSFIRFAGHNPFCSASITVFEHSIRLYLMTLHSAQLPRLLNRKSTGGHYATQIMEQFNRLRKCLGNDNFEEFVRFNIADVQLSKENMLHDAMCHINTTVAPDIPRTYMQLSLPLKTASAPLSILHHSFNAKLQSSINQDSSIIFIDINQPDMKGTHSKNIDFPLVMTRKLPDNESAVYQTAGAIYWCPSIPCDLYHVSIVTRSRKQVDSILYNCYEYDINPAMGKVTKNNSLQFPAIKKIDHKTYYLKGVIMFLSVLNHYCRTAEYEFQKYEVLRAASETTSGNEICVSNIKGLLAYTISIQDKSCWLDNNTIYEVLSSFAAFLGDKRNYVMNPDASHGLIQYLLYPEKVVGDTDGAYERFKTIGRRSYKNMFSSNDICVHFAVNEPERSHWNFVLVLVNQNTIIVHDPMHSESRVKKLGQTIFNICCQENTDNGGGKDRMANWFIKTKIPQPQQPDLVSCGVFTIISSMRAMVLIKQNRTDELRQSWNFASKANNIVRYRKSFAKILLDDDKDVELNNFVNMFSKT